MSSFKQTAPHPHAGGVCPVVGKSHEYCPPQEYDSRSPCPALNTLANHGYLPRNGKNINMWDVMRALQEGYNLSLPLAFVLAFGGYLAILTFGRTSLFHIGQHGRVEHNASLVHRDTPPGDTYAPIRIDSGLVDELMNDMPAPSKSGRALMTAVDVARARVRREKASPPLDPVHAEIARGEMAIVLGMMRVHDGQNEGVPVEWFKEWISEERLPKGWNRDRVQGLLDTVWNSLQIRFGMIDIRKQQSEKDQRMAVTASPIRSSGHSKSSSSSSTMTASSTMFSFVSEKYSRSSSPNTSVEDVDDEKEF